MSRAATTGVAAARSLAPPPIELAPALDLHRPPDAPAEVAKPRLSDGQHQPPGLEHLKLVAHRLVVDRGRLDARVEEEVGPGEVDACGDQPPGTAQVTLVAEPWVGAPESDLHALERHRRAGQPRSSDAPEPKLDGAAVRVAADRRHRCIARAVVLAVEPDELRLQGAWQLAELEGRRSLELERGARRGGAVRAVGLELIPHHRDGNRTRRIGDEGRAGRALRLHGHAGGRGELDAVAAQSIRELRVEVACVGGGQRPAPNGLEVLPGNRPNLAAWWANCRTLSA